jgi:SAM-dependent methyltransferase
MEAASVLVAPAVEAEHVHRVYDSIAPHFSHTRHHPWPIVTDFLRALPAGALVADVGCGNGKYLGVDPRLCLVGADRSVPLLRAGCVSFTDAYVFALSDCWCRSGTDPDCGVLQPATERAWRRRAQAAAALGHLRRSHLCRRHAPLVNGHAAPRDSQVLHRHHQRLPNGRVGSLTPSSQ